MNVFADSKQPLRPLSPEAPGTRIAGLVLLVCLALGSALVVWHISADARRVRAAAAALAQARATAIELQLQSTASVPLKDLAARAGLDDLWKAGYSYSLFVPATAQRRATGLLLRGEVSLNNSVRQPIKARNFTLCLAVQPRDGWINKPRALLDIGVLLLVSGLFWVGARLLESKRAMTLELVDLQQRAEHDSRQRQQAEEEGDKLLLVASTQEAELKKARAALQQSQTLATESAVRLEDQVRNAQQARDEAQTKIQAAEQALAQLQDQLVAANQAGQEAATAHETAQEQTHAALKESLAKIADLQRRLDETGRAYREALAVNLKQTAENQEAISALQSRLETAGEQAAKLTARLQEARTELAAAQSGVAPAAGESAEVDVAAAADPDPASPVQPAGPMGEDPSLEEVALTEPPEVGAAATSPPLPVETPVDEIKPAPLAADSAPAVPAPPSRPGRRKKSRRDLQMDLFAAPPAPEETGVRLELAAIDNEVVEAWPIEPEPPATPQPAGETAGEPEELPAAADSPEVPVVPEIAGLSTTEGLAWADGNSELYLKALREFSQLHAGTGDRIRAALEQGDAQDAEQAARALKSAAGDIGATALAESAATLARAIHEHEEPGELESAWSKVETSLHELLLELKPAVKPRETKSKPAPSRQAPAPPPLNPSLFRKAVSLILPLLTDGDPGARDCLKDNRNTFRSGFSTEGYADFEQMIKQRDYAAALESLKKIVKKHGIPA